ncbi:hypothetical protein [Xanthomonas sp. XNM01]|uniref:hypothetical protein n=1 Tax=Xanthomonas sp. XNM01 TaxID=2769289 RepID=UPI00177C649C|nr:hypothetical protein [Xanthomonas sp. XNM01]MBD9368366.1 hypothetical protein [Xanthomonas sp. XNM01]
MIITGTDLPIALLIGCAFLIFFGVVGVDDALSTIKHRRIRRDHRALVMLSDAYRFLAAPRAQVQP